MNLTGRQKEKLKGILSDPNWHPADYYNYIDKLPSNAAKLMAQDLNLPYKNKRSFAKNLIELLEFVKNNIINI